ncbi:biotin/lipoyl-binding protein [Clostridium sp.]|jgi:HlyD family secretion protein|uniref:efflux RND transporter periplasmic adaptor subunit n=1 Tax=Clostridium sp. TaxID=1506 RepID=UPI00258DC767|nr:biotin/lipoyl-binding protein [Clostridium sp.]MDF2502632.1 rane-fusion protein [Clostridium sp.]
MKKKVIIGIIVAVVVVGIVGLRVSARNKGNFVAVKTAKVTKGNINAYLSTTATIKSKNSKNYFIPQQGKVKTVNVKVGDKVKKGDVLVTYQVQDLSGSVKQAQISLNTAESQKQDLLNTVSSNNQKLSDINNQINDTKNQINKLTDQQKKDPNFQKDGGATQLQQLNSTLSQLNTSKSSIPDSSEKLKQADNQIKLAQVNLDTANTNAAQSTDKNVADFDGVVTAVNAVVGSSQAVGASSSAGSSSAGAAVTIEDQSNLQAEVNLDKYSASEVKVGQTSDLTFANKDYKGKVSYVAPAAETTTSTSGQTTILPADIDIDAPQDGLVEGFDADVNILIGQVNDIIKVPTESIKTDKSGKNYVFVVSNNKAVQKEVQLGLQSDTEAQINSGVNIGDKVILNPSASMQNGTAVKDSTSTGGK